MLVLSDEIMEKYEGEEDINLNPTNISDGDFRELICYVAVVSQSEHKALKLRVDHLEEEVRSLTTAMENKDAEVEQLKEDKDKLNKRCDDMRVEFDSFKNDFSLLSDEVINLQRYTREWGLRFNNIAESPNENCVKLVEGALAKVQLGHVKIENAHRIGPKPDDGSPRTIAARCLYRPERREVLNNRKRLFEMGIPTFESLCKHDSDLKRRYGDVMKKLYNEGKRVYFSKGQVMVNGQKYTGPEPPPLASHHGPRPARRRDPHAPPPVVINID